MPHSPITNTDTTNNTVYIYCCYGMTKYNTSKMEHRFTTNFHKPHVPIFLLLLSNVCGLKEMKIAKCFSTVCMSHTATFHRELGGVYLVWSLPYYHITQTQGGLIGFDKTWAAYCSWLAPSCICLLCSPDADSSWCTRSISPASNILGWCDDIAKGIQGGHHDASIWPQACQP